MSQTMADATAGQRSWRHKSGQDSAIDALLGSIGLGCKILITLQGKAAGNGLQADLADVAHLGNIADNVAHFWAHSFPQLLLCQHAALQCIVQQSSCHTIIAGF